MSTRETWVFPAEGGAPYLKGSAEHAERNTGKVIFMPDLADFVSPIDGKRYSGRAGLREHNKRHDVVSNSDLKGLPVLTTTSDTRDKQQIARDKQVRKELIINQVNKHFR